MYRRLREAYAWYGTHLDESRGHPLTHDILAALNLLEPDSYDSGRIGTVKDFDEVAHSMLISEGVIHADRPSRDKPRSMIGHHLQPTALQTGSSLFEVHSDSDSTTPHLLDQNLSTRARQGDHSRQQEPVSTAPANLRSVISQTTGDWSLPCNAPSSLAISPSLYGFGIDPGSTLPPADFYTDCDYIPLALPQTLGSAHDYTDILSWTR
jgi:hypothetical protein